MASILDMSASSDSEDDVDYVPPNAAASDSSCDEELLSDDEAKTTKKGELTDYKKDAESDSFAAKVDSKQRAKDLWETFLNEETVTPKKSNPAMSKDNITTAIRSESETKVSKIDLNKSVTNVFEFAGETLTVDKDLNSCQSTVGKSNLQPVPLTEKVPCVCMPKKRGIDSVLSTIMNKGKKLTVLEKSKIDWITFKNDEGLDNELKTFNKGKKGYIERKRFLERSDLRSFEMEKSMRQTLRKK